MHARKLAERLRSCHSVERYYRSKPWWFIPSSGTCSRIKYSLRGNRVYASYDHDEQGAFKVLHRASGDGEGMIVVAI